jgi:hypothetical protein
MCWKFQALVVDQQDIPEEDRLFFWPREVVTYNCEDHPHGEDKIKPPAAIPVEFQLMIAVEMSKEIKHYDPAFVEKLERILKIGLWNPSIFEKYLLRIVPYWTDI